MLQIHYIHVSLKGSWHASAMSDPIQMMFLVRGIGVCHARSSDSCKCIRISFWLTKVLLFRGNSRGNIFVPKAQGNYSEALLASGHCQYHS